METQTDDIKIEKREIEIQTDEASEGIEKDNTFLKNESVDMEIQTDHLTIKDTELESETKDIKIDSVEMEAQMDESTNNIEDKDTIKDLKKETVQTDTNCEDLSRVKRRKP